MAADDFRSPELAPGSVFAGRYRVDRAVGRGGMGTVYRAHDEQLGEEVALKLLDGHDLDPSRLERFRREVRLARRIAHRNVARTYDLGEHAGQFFLSMELVEGTSLRAELNEHGALSPERAASLGRQLADGLAAAHEAGVLHRDLKPANVLLAEGDRAVIVDFGIARPLDEASTMTHGLLGTPRYMAPEQLSDGVVGPHSDVYALGLVLFELFTGTRTPFVGGDAIVARLVGQPDLSALDRRPALKQLLSEVLALEGRERPTARAVSKCLAALFAEGEACCDEETVTRQVRQSGVPFAPLPLAERRLAVIPFREIGGDGSFASAISQELVDVLAGIRGVCVLSLRGAPPSDGGTAEYGRELGADFVVDGTLQRSGPQVRLTARLHDISRGLQLWSERFEGEIVDVFALQEMLARRVAEGLRTEIPIATLRGKAPLEAIDLYLEGRAKLQRRDVVGPQAAAAVLERALALAPQFPPALAAHAMACVKGWFAAQADPGIDWQDAASRSVARALEHAGDIAESQLAAALASAQRSDFPSVAYYLRRALALAPTCAPAQEYLGLMQCEAGKLKEGLERARLALALDPLSTLAWSALARDLAFAGKWQQFDSACEAALEAGGPRLVVVRQLQMRSGFWRGDLELARELVTDVPQGDLLRQFYAIYSRFALGDISRDELERGFAARRELIHSSRALVYSLQLMTECMAVRGELDGAAAYLERAGGEALIDRDWLERCPVLGPLRNTESFRKVALQVANRAEAIWSV